MNTASVTPIRADVSFDTVPACDMPDGCGAGIGQPCEPGCPSIATDTYDAFTDDAPEVLIIAEDDTLIAELLPLITAIGPVVTTARVRTDDADALAEAWTVAGTVLVGGDVAAQLAQASLPYRGDVLIVAEGSPDGEPTTDVWRSAVALGAGHVAVLPLALPWLIEKLRAGR